ncbi:indolethylamine N-methyltransferase-like [Phyllobates terribilis]|uniref:indolethylamine N-methyltransferase-like n=1 Tax=Phyllobates terribilis TaxID=111132 RepID=UPI003CCAF71D
MEESSNQTDDEQFQLRLKASYNHFLSADVPCGITEEFLCFPMRQLHKELSEGHIKGKTLVQLTRDPVLYKLFVCCDYFEEITVLEIRKEYSLELRKWMNKESGALDWSHASKYACELEGKSKCWREKEEELRAKVKRILDCDITADPLVAPEVLPQADCLLCIWALDTLSKDHEDFRNNLRKMAALLKTGGHMAFFGAINAKQYNVGEKTYPVLGYDEEFLRRALEDVGFVIESLETRVRGAVGDIIIYDSFVYVRALKVKEA